MGPEWESIDAQVTAQELLKGKQTHDEKKQRLRQFANNKLVDKHMIHHVWMEGEGRPIITCTQRLRVHTMLPKKLNGDKWE